MTSCSKTFITPTDSETNQVTNLTGDSLAEGCNLEAEKFDGSTIDRAVEQVEQAEKRSQQ